MIEYRQIELMLALVMGGYLLLISLTAVWLLRPPARKVLYGVTLVAMLIIGLHPVTRGQLTFWDWFLQPSSELAGGAIFSSMQYVIVAILAVLIGLYGKWERAWQRGYWFAVAVLFAFLCLDEYFSLHETVLLWRYLYPLTGLAIVMLTIGAWWFAFRKDWQVMVLTVAGLGVMGFAGVALDAFSNEQYLQFGSYELEWFHCSFYYLGIPCQQFGLVEEFLEMVGVGLILAAFFSYLLTRVPKARHRQSRRAILIGAAVWVLWTISNLWFIPTIEQFLFAERFPVVFADENLQLLGYRRFDAQVAPGEDVDLTVYFNARQDLDTPYYLSVHVLSKPDAESVAQFDLQLGEWKYPSTGWAPGFAVRNRIHLTLPDDLPYVPGGYWVTGRVWKDLSTELNAPPIIEGLPIVESTHRLLTDDTVVLFSLPVVPEDYAAPDPPRAADYRFDGDFGLAGYELPETATLGEPLPLAFWWRTGRNPATTGNYIQFIHLFHENGEDYRVYDKAPFENRFPTADWPANQTFVDRFDIPLPDDLPPGEYTVQTGMYEPVNKDRIRVTDSAGEAVQDFSIVLGTMTVTAP